MAMFFRKSKDRFAGAGKHPAGHTLAEKEHYHAPPAEQIRREHIRSDRIRFAGTVLVAAAVMAAVGFGTSWAVAPAAGWAVATAFFSANVWLRVGGMGPAETKAHANVDDPSRAVREILVLSANVIALAAVVLLIVESSRAEGWQKFVYAAIALVAVASSWVMLQTIYTLRYAAAHYGSDPPEGIYFNTEDPPQYLDFAYLSFTIGMSYAASDEAVTSTEIRRIALGHSLLSFIFGTGIVATTISLIVGLF